MNPWMGQVASGNPDSGSHQISLFNLNPLLQKNRDNQKFWQSKLCFKNTIVWIAIAPQKSALCRQVNRRTFFSESRVNELMAITKNALHAKNLRSRFQIFTTALISGCLYIILSSSAPISTFLMCKDDARIRDNFKSYAYKPLPAIVGNKEICIEWTLDRALALPIIG